MKKMITGSLTKKDNTLIKLNKRAFLNIRCPFFMLLKGQHSCNKGKTRLWKKYSRSIEQETKPSIINGFFL